MAKANRKRKKETRQSGKKPDSQPDRTAKPGPGAKPEGKDKKPDQPLLNWPLGLILTSLLSLAVGIYIGWTVNNSLGLLQGVKWGLIAGVSIWLAFTGSYWINRYLRRR